MSAESFRHCGAYTIVRRRLHRPIWGNPLTGTLRAIFAATVVLALFRPVPARARYTETPPKFTLILDQSFIFAWVDGFWDDNGNRTSLVEPIERYEPGGPKQGTLYADPYVTTALSVTQVYFGILENLTLAFGMPVVMKADIDTRLSWEEGDYQPRLGGKYTEALFWDWAEALGQPKPQDFSGNKGVQSDLVLGLRYRFTDHFEVFQKIGLRMAFSIYGAVPTGVPADPEEVVAIGTTLWDMNAQGDLAFHLGMDKTFENELDGRFTLGFDVYYEHFFERERYAGTGETNPLLKNEAPYVGETYKIKPGDYSGFSISAEGVLYEGPMLKTWITPEDPKLAERLPPILTLEIGYKFMHLQQTDWMSSAPHWEWERENRRRPGYRNTLNSRISLTLLRVGVPLMFYLIYSNGTWIPGKNSPHSDMLTAGFSIPVAF